MATLIRRLPVVLALSSFLLPVQLSSQNVAAAREPAGPPPSTGGFFPLSQVHRGLHAIAWTVFTGTVPEPMDVEILGVLKGARGPGHDMILAQLHGAKPEYTGVVAGMSGSPVYIGDKLLGSLSYRIGEFSKDPIAGITPIEQMLEVRDLPIEGSGVRNQGLGIADAKQSYSAQRISGSGMSFQAPEAGMNFEAMETPLTMSGFGPAAIQLWQQKMAGSGLEMVAAGGVGSGSSASTADAAAALASVVPGSAVSAQLVRGDLEIAATCTVTYIDAKQLLACGHPILQAGPVSLPMTTAEVVTTLASPLNAFKIVNTGATIGAFTEDRDAAIRGVLGAKARMIPVSIEVHGGGATRKLNIEILDLPSLMPQAFLVSLYQALQETNQNTAETSYHLTGSVDLAGAGSVPLDLWAPAGEQLPAPMNAAVQAAEEFSRIYLNENRQRTGTEAVQGIDLHIEAIPRELRVELAGARLISGNIVHAGDTVEVEATLRPWQQPERNVRIRVTLPARLSPGNLRLLVSDASTLDRTLDQPKQANHPVDIETIRAQALRRHSADRVYVSLLTEETQAGVVGQALTSLPLSVANALEPMHQAQEVSLNGESAEVGADAPVGGVLSGFQVLNLRIEAGGGLN
jgi:hypothetical protein